MKKRIIIITLTLLLFIGVAGTFWGPSIAEARTTGIWNSCPRGEVNDPYPGDCRDYIDTDKDGICDRSQPAPQAITSPATSTTSAIVEPAITGGAAPGNSESASAVDIASPAGTEEAAGNGRGRGYYFIPVMAVFIGLYALTWILSAKKVFKVLTHRKIWNIVLLVSCLVSAVLGIVLVFNIEFHTYISLPFNTLFWHVEAGLAMSVIAVFHIAWHWRYFTKILKTKEQK